MVENIFEYSDYRQALKDLLWEKKKNKGKRYTLSNLAAHCGVGRPYLSKVLGGEGHLSDDHTFSACRFLELGESAQEFIMDLQGAAKTKSTTRKLYLQQRIDTVRSRHLEVSVTLERDTNDCQKNLEAFYTDVYAQLVHMFLTIPRFALKPQDIEKYLNISKDHLQACLDKCEKCGLIVQKPGRVVVLQNDLHLPRGSELHSGNQREMRLAALAKSQQLDPDLYQFSTLFSAEPQAAPKVKKYFLEFIEKLKNLADDSNPTDVYQINFDFLKWS